MVSLISFLLVIAVCVIIHEGGHYLTAVWRNVQVHEFAFGMGPKLFSRRRNGVIWSVRALPIGGFVRLEGEEDESRPEDVPDSSRSFQNRKSWERFVIIAGGAAMNIVLAWLLMTFSLATHGVLDMKTPKIGTLMENYPAAQMGALQGDMILSINGQPIKEWGDIRGTLQNLPTDDAVIVVGRNGSQETLTGKIPYSKEHDGRLFGVKPSRAVYPIGKALTNGLSFCWMLSVEIIKGLWQMLTGAIPADVQGPVGIARYAGEAAREGFWTFIAFVAVINLNLGLLNLLPFPALDGGRLVFLFGEMVSGRKFPEQWESRIHLVGFALLLALLAFVTWKDIMSLMKL